MKRSRGSASPSIYMYIKFEYARRTAKNERGVNLSTALLDSNVSHKLYKNERSKLGETKCLGRYDEEAFNEILHSFPWRIQEKTFSRVFRSNSNRSQLFQLLRITEESIYVRLRIRVLCRTPFYRSKRNGSDLIDRAERENLSVLSPHLQKAVCSSVRDFVRGFPSWRFVFFSGRVTLTVA